MRLITLVLLFSGLTANLRGARGADFEYTVSNDQITITRYIGPGGAVVVPSSIGGLPVVRIGDGAFSVTIGNATASASSVQIADSVTSIGDFVFYENSRLTDVYIGAGVTNIGGNFGFCPLLEAITVNEVNQVFESREGVLYTKNAAELIKCPEMNVGPSVIPFTVTNLYPAAFSYCRKLTQAMIHSGVKAIPDALFNGCTSLQKVTIPESVDSIGRYSFYGCSSLSVVTIPAAVTNIGNFAFAACSSVKAFQFEGDAPVLEPSVFSGAGNGTVFYLPEKNGWSDAYGGLPTALWRPQANTGDEYFGVRQNEFGFTVTWASGKIVVIEASSDLVNPIWQPVATNVVIAGSSYFRDFGGVVLPARMYRVRSR